MNASMYTMSAPVFARMLGNLSAILDKLAAHAEAKKIDPAVFLNARLYPDMFPFTRQVQLVSDFAKGCLARLAGHEPPKWEDNESTVAELKARIAKTIDYVQAFKPNQIDGSEERAIELVVRGDTVKISGLAYLANRILPNFYFHTTTAYAILRHNGVEVGKTDFVGRV